MTSLKTASKETINLSDMLFLFIYFILFYLFHLFYLFYLFISLFIFCVYSQEELCMNGGVQLAIGLTFDITIPLSLMATNCHKHRVL